MLSELNYTQVEGYGALFRSGVEIAELNAALTAFNLEMPTVHLALHKLLTVPDRIVALSKRIGFQIIVIPNVPQNQRPQKPAAWADHGHTIAEAARPLRDAGLEVLYHTHDYEVCPLEDGSNALDHILEADPELQIQFDPAWAFRAKQDPARIIEHYGHRIRAAHIKDVAQAGQNIQENGWADVGQGAMDWNAIWSALNAANVQFRVVEHNAPADHWRFARRSINAIRNLDAQSFVMT